MVFMYVLSCNSYMYICICLYCVCVCVLFAHMHAPNKYVHTYIKTAHKLLEAGT